MYRWVRCTNYLGGILVWTGNALMAVGHVASWWQGMVALTRWVCITSIMVRSAKRLERYDDQPELAQYVLTVPVMLPRAPIYRLQ